MRVSIDKETGRATVACAICQLKDEFDAHPQAQAIDVYSYFTDRFYGVKDPRAIIPRDRPPAATLQESSETEEEEKEADSELAEPSRLSEPTETPSSEEPFSDRSIVAETKPDVGSSTEEAASNTDVLSTEAPAKDEQAKEDEENPFADILDTPDKEKKRYSAHPIEQETSTTGSSSQ